MEETALYAKKFVRYDEGAKKYSMGLSKFQMLAREAKATYKVDKLVLVNCLKNIWRLSGNIKENLGSVQVTIKCGIGLDLSKEKEFVLFYKKMYVMVNLYFYHICC